MRKTLSIGLVYTERFYPEFECPVGCAKKRDSFTCVVSKCVYKGKRTNYEGSRFPVMTWCLYFLTKHLEVQEKVFKELEEVLGDEDIKPQVSSELK